VIAVQNTCHLKQPPSKTVRGKTDVAWQKSRGAEFQIDAGVVTL
jgi:hypothetical protein